MDGPTTCARVEIHKAGDTKELGGVPGHCQGRKQKLGSIEGGKQIILGKIETNGR